MAIEDLAFRNDTYTFNNQEFNLAKMIRDTIILVMNRYPTASIGQHAALMNISERTLYRYKKHFNIAKKTTIEYIAL